MTRVGDYLRKELLSTHQPHNARARLRSWGLDEKGGTFFDLECSHIEVRADIFSFLVLEAVLDLLDGGIVDEVKAIGHSHHCIQSEVPVLMFCSFNQCTSSAAAASPMKRMCPCGDRRI